MRSGGGGGGACEVEGDRLWFGDGGDGAVDCGGRSGADLAERGLQDQFLRSAAWLGELFDGEGGCRKRLAEGDSEDFGGANEYCGGGLCVAAGWVSQGELKLRFRGGDSREGSIDDRVNGVSIEIEFGGGGCASKDAIVGAGVAVGPDLVCGGSSVARGGTVPAVTRFRGGDLRAGLLRIGFGRGG